MTWNYRVVHKDVKGCDDDDAVFAIHEAYYTDEEAPGITLRPVAPIGNTLEELRAELQHMLTALDQPTLEYKDYDPDWHPGRYPGHGCSNT